MDCSLPFSSVRGIFQARILEGVAMSFPRGSSRPRDRTRVSYVSCIGKQAFITSAEKPIIIVFFNYYLCYLFRAAERFLLVAVLGLFLAKVSPVVEHGLSTCGARAEYLWSTG